MYLDKNEIKLTNEYLENGYVIQPVADFDALNWMRNKFVEIVSEYLGISNIKEPEEFLNYIHDKIEVKELNQFRLKVIRAFNSESEFREMYYRVARPYLEILVGNELAMQLRVNLSIQFPNDDSSLLPVHADTWSGDSPYEVVVWLPIVNCYGSKAMYLLPPTPSEILSKDFKEMSGKNSEDLYQSIKSDVKWLDVKFGEVLVFDQALPHGNRLNIDKETRWSMNCRFKSVFTPYGDKKLGEFFEPITLRAATQVGMKYKLPNV